MPPQVISPTTPKPERWNAEGFVHEFARVHERMPDRAYAFILGAGASQSSGIPTGIDLVRTWIGELHQLLDFNGTPLRDWATAANLNIPDFDYDHAGAFYPEVFERRFRDDHEAGFAALEHLIDGKEPGIGYSVLARLLSSTRHNVVITTNFDDLVADALYLHSSKHPLVCGHESLTQFVSARMRRPLVAKIHRHLFYGPLTDPDGTASLQREWQDALTTLCSNYTPVIIGYGGNDGSLMSFLESEAAEVRMPGGLYWCYYAAGGEPDDRILRIIARHKGKLIPILGFDELMVQLGDVMRIPILDPTMVQNAKDRDGRYENKLKELYDLLTAPTRRPSNLPDRDTEIVKEAVSNSIGYKDGWWSFETRARAAESASEKDKIYREGLQQWPQSAALAGNYARFLASIDEHDRANDAFLNAISLDPKHASNLATYGDFLYRARNDPAGAEEYYRQALQQQPQNSIAQAGLSHLLRTVKRDFYGAEQLYLNSRPPIVRQPSDPEREIILSSARDHARRVIEELLAQSSSPIVSAVVADSVAQAIGPAVLGSDWCGTLGFKDFISGIQGARFEVSWEVPGYFFDSSRHERPSSSFSSRPQVRVHSRDDVNALAQRLHYLQKVPLWSSQEYSEVFRAIIRSLTQHGFSLTTITKDVQNDIRRDLPGVSITRKDVGFVVKGIGLAGLDLRTLPPPPEDELRAKFITSLRYLCGNLGILHRDLIEVWLTPYP